MGAPQGHRKTSRSRANEARLWELFRSAKRLVAEARIVGKTPTGEPLWTLKQGAMLALATWTDQLSAAYGEGKD